MLIRFNLGNFLSFSATEFGLSEEISMIADTKIKNKKRHIFDNDEIQLLKFAALYGKDITDTKNLVKAMRFMKDVILNGLPSDCQKVNCPDQTKPSYFELEMMIHNKYYAYGFQVILSQAEFTSEWLVELKSDGSERIIYENGFAHTENRLRLPSAKEEVMQNVYKWIKEDFIVYSSDLNQPDNLILNEDKTYIASFENCKDQNEIYAFVQEYLKLAEKIYRLNLWDKANMYFFVNATSKKEAFEIIKRYKNFSKVMDLDICEDDIEEVDWEKLYEEEKNE